MPEPAKDVVGRGEDHDAEEHDEADLRQAQAELERQRLPAYGVRDEERRLPAVEDRDRQQGENREVDGQERHEAEEGPEADRGGLPRDLPDQGRAAEVAWPCLARRR